MRSNIKLLNGLVHKIWLWCKSKEIWKIPCPVFVRGIGMEGGIGPVAGSSHHSLYYRMPGVKIASPMTPMEYIKNG